jgi:serine/threonine protein kinase
LGPVFRAYEPDRDRLVAVKVFRLDLPPERVHQLVSEFERLIEAGLRHAAITTPVATGLNGVVAYLAQDYFSGDSLDIVMRENGPMPVAETLRVARQLAEGLDFAAERQVEHGALNPRDILVSPESACIVGIGVTRALEHIGAATPIRRPYTSPERVAGEAWDRRADVFSLAAVVYEMLWGRRLVGTGMQAVETMTPLNGAHLAALQAVFAGALAEQAVDRFGTAAEFVESLERAASDQTTSVEAIDLAGAEALSPSSKERLRVVEPRRADVAALLLPLEDPEDPEDDVERDLPEPVIQLREPEFESEPELPAHAESGPGFALAEPMEPEQPLLLREPLPPREPLALREPLAPLEPLEPRRKSDPVREPAAAPSFLTSPALSGSSSRSSSVVWPIGLACVVGLAIGFGVGYTVGTGDRANVVQPTAQPAAVPDAPAERTFTESTVTTPQAPVRTELPRPESAAPVVPFSGRVVVRSTPPGARVVVDGRDRGVAPAAVSGLGQGEHRVRVLHDGYTTAERRVVLSPSQPSQALTVPLAKAPVAPKPGASQTAKTEAAPAAPKPGSIAAADAGVLVLDSRPTGASVFVDGKSVGRTPLTLSETKAGDHTVRFELDEHRPWTASIKVIGGTTNRVGGSLEKID